MRDRNVLTLVLQVKGYDRLIFDLSRVLRPGGLTTVCELENHVFEVDHPPYETVAYQTFPCTARAIDFIRGAITDQGIDLSAIHKIDEWLQLGSLFWAETAKKYGYVQQYNSVLSDPYLFDFMIRIPNAGTIVASRGFRDIHREVVLIPTGTWHPDPNVQKVGSLASRTWILAWKQLEPLLVEGGLTPEQANEVATAAIQELQCTELPVLFRYHVMYGTKI